MLDRNYKVELSGFDYFHLNQDIELRASGSKGNTCILYLRLDKALEASDTLPLLRSQTLQTLSALRLRGCISKEWQTVADSQQEIIQIVRTDHESLIDYISTLSIDPAYTSPFQAIATHTTNEDLHGIIFAWHHSLLDAHGAEMAIAQILEELADQETKPQAFSALLPKTILSPFKDLSKTWKALNAAKKAIFQKSSGKISTQIGETRSKSKQRYLIVHLSTEQQSGLEQNYERFSMGFFKSAYHLACVSKAFQTVRDELNYSAEDLCVVVPHDLRRSVKHREIISDKLSSLFFRLPSDGCTIQQLTDQIVDQLQDMVASRFADNLRIFFNVIKLLPRQLASALVKKPSQSKFCSFYFSDTGDKISQLKDIGSSKITDVTHYPPLLTPPPFSVVFSKYDSRMKIIMTFDDNKISKETMSKFAQIITELLSGTKNA